MGEKTGGVFQVGLNRVRYLDLANMHFIQQNYDAVKESLYAFLDTIDDESEPGRYIIEQFDLLYDERKRQREELECKIADSGFLEQSITGNNGFMNIDLEILHGMKAVCWTASQKFGLLYE